MLFFPKIPCGLWIHRLCLFKFWIIFLNQIFLFFFPVMLHFFSINILGSFFSSHMCDFLSNHFNSTHSLLILLPFPNPVFHILYWVCGSIYSFCMLPAGTSSLWWHCLLPRFSKFCHAVFYLLLFSHCFSPELFSLCFEFLFVGDIYSLHLKNLWSHFSFCPCQYSSGEFFIFLVLLYFKFSFGMSVKILYKVLAYGYSFCLRKWILPTLHMRKGSR